MLSWNDVLKFVKDGNPPPPRRLELTDAQWHERLTPEQYQVTRLKGTERPFSSEMCSLFEPGVIAYHADRSLGMMRVETICNVCDAHLGHVFPDGPPPGRLRFCINALSLRHV